MKSAQKRFSDLESADWKAIEDVNPDFILTFGHPKFFENGDVKKLKQKFPNSQVMGCSTAGEIDDGGVFDESLVVTAISFEDPKYKFVQVKTSGIEESVDAGKSIANQLNDSGLTSIFLLSRGLDINGSGIIEGMRSVVEDKVLISGGLAGDAGAFKETFTVLNDQVTSDSIVAMGVYDNSIQVDFGTYGGWETFGPVRVVTESEGNVMYKLDGEPALDVYKKYLGDDAKDLPASGLLFPFSLLDENEDQTGIIRTILAIDEEKGSLTFAGDIPLGGRVRLMHSKNDALVAGAKKAAEQIDSKDSVAVLISCVGRKLVMGDDIDDEVDAVKDNLDSDHYTGFYSYGEIAPHGVVTDCRLHNQTMTITTFADKKKAS